MRELALGVELVARNLQTPVDLLGGVRPPRPEPLTQSLRPRRSHKDEDGAGDALPDLPGPLNLDLQDHSAAEGEPLLDRVPLPPIRRLDVAKAFLGLFNQTLFSAVMYPLLPRATKYAMDALKRSVHNCYFCYHASAAPLAAEVAFFEERYGPDRTLKRLLALRQAYRPSLGFVLSCLPALARLHLNTALDVRFPRAARMMAGSERRGADLTNAEAGK